jgi:hypothetical protein
MEDEMTHSIGMRIKIKEYDDVIELKRLLLNPEEDDGMIFYSMKFSEGIMENARGLCPFLIFPDNKSDTEKGWYWVFADTGSHCDWSDMAEVLYCWTFWVILKELLDSIGCEYEYGISEDGEDHHYTLGQAFALIRRENPEFAALFPHGRLSDAVGKRKTG